MKIVRFVALLPRNACVAHLRAYRAAISPLYGDVCRYYPSCSTYTLQAIQHHGAIKGIGLGAWRIVRCNPWASGGIDDIPAAHSGPHTQAKKILASGFVVPGPDTSRANSLPLGSLTTSSSELSRSMLSPSMLSPSSLSPSSLSSPRLSRLSQRKV